MNITTYLCIPFVTYSNIIPIFSWLYTPGASLLRPGFQHPGLPRSLPCCWKWTWTRWIYGSKKGGDLGSQIFEPLKGKANFTLKPDGSDSKLTQKRWRYDIFVQKCNFEGPIQVHKFRCLTRHTLWPPPLWSVSSNDLDGAPVTRTWPILDTLEHTYVYV